MKHNNQLTRLLGYVLLFNLPLLLTNCGKKEISFSYMNNQEVTESVDALKALPAADKLEIGALNFEKCNIGYATDSLVAYFQDPNCAVTKLNLAHDNRIWFDGFATRLTPVLQSSKLQELYLGGALATEYKANIKSLQAACQHLPSTLEILDLSDNKITDADLEKLAPYLPTAHVKELNVSYNNLGGAGRKVLLASLPKSLEKLNLSGNNRVGGVVEAAPSCLVETNIKWLDLCNSKLGDEGLQALLTAGFPKSLEYLNLSQNDLSEACMEMLAGSLQKTPIKCLKLNGNKIGGRGLKTLLSGLPESLEVLELAGNLLEGADFETLATCLPRLKKLQELSLDGDKLADKEMQTLITHVLGRDIRLLNLYMEVNDNKALILAEYLKNADTRQMAIRLVHNRYISISKPDVISKETRATLETQFRHINWEFSWLK